MQGRLVTVGFLLMFVGAVLLAFTIAGGSSPPDATPAQQTVEPADASEPSRVMPIASGLLLAGGAALLGIGMNRWRGRERGPGR